MTAAGRTDGGSHIGGGVEYDAISVVSLPVRILDPNGPESRWAREEAASR